MHTLLIHQAFMSSNEGGGTRHLELGGACVLKGHRFTVVASDVSYLTGQRLDSRDEVDHGVRILRARTVQALHRSFLWRFVAFAVFMCSSFWKAVRVKQVDLVMGTSPALTQALAAWMVAFVRRRRFLLEIRDLWPDFAIDMGVLKNPLLIWLARRLENFLYRRADHVLVNSPAYRDFLIDRGIAADRISLVPNGVDPTMFDPESDGADQRRELGLNGKFVVSYAGAIGPANDIGTIVRAAGQLSDDPSIHFLLIGDGKERSRMDEMIAQAGLGNVTLLGMRPKSQLKELLAASNACIATLMDIPMFTMPYPNKVFDYMAAGRPTVLGIGGAIREVIERADGGIYVQPGDATAVADAVRQLNRDPQRAAEMGRNARTYVCEHFNREDQADRFLEVLIRISLLRNTN